MKLVPAKFILAFRNGYAVVWGTPEFMSEEEGQCFLRCVSEELLAGANNYFTNCCGAHESADGTTGQTGSVSLALMPGASQRTRLIFARASSLVHMGRKRLKKRKIEHAQQVAGISDIGNNEVNRGIGYGR